MAPVRVRVSRKFLLTYSSKPPWTAMASWRTVRTFLKSSWPSQDPLLSLFVRPVSRELGFDRLAGRLVRGLCTTGRRAAWGPNCASSAGLSLRCLSPPPCRRWLQHRAPASRRRTRLLRLHSPSWTRGSIVSIIALWISNMSCTLHHPWANLLRVEISAPSPRWLSWLIGSKTNSAYCRENCGFVRFSFVLSQ